jgi:hypothetical protein
VLRRVDKEFSDMAPLLRIAPPQTSLAEKYQELVAAAKG